MHSAASATSVMAMRWSSVRRSMSVSDSSRARVSTMVGCSTCRRENASSLPVSSAPRRVARMAAPMSCCDTASPPMAGESSSTCRLPEITVSRLLKSCAMPPVSCPTLSSRCAWPSASSICVRCNTVASKLDSDSRKRTSSSPKRLAVRERTDSTPMVRPRSASGTVISQTKPAAR